MPAGLQINAALSTTWLPWLCLAMIILVWLSCIMQPQYLRGLVGNSFASFTIGIAEQVPSIGSQIAQWLFNSTVPALAVYILIVDSAVYGLELFGNLLFISLAIDLARALIAALVQYTFRFGKRLAVAYMRYFSLRTLLSFVLFFVLLLMAYTSTDVLWLSLLGVAIGVYLICIGIQWTKLFCTSLPDMVGVIIYLFTVELLPAVLLLEAGRQLYIQQFA